MKLFHSISVALLITFILNHSVHGDSTNSQAGGTSQASTVGEGTATSSGTGASSANTSNGAPPPPAQGSEGDSGGSSLNPLKGGKLSLMSGSM